MAAYKFFLLMKQSNAMWRPSPPKCGRWHRALSHAHYARQASHFGPCAHSFLFTPSSHIFTCDYDALHPSPFGGSSEAMMDESEVAGPNGRYDEGTIVGLVTQLYYMLIKPGQREEDDIAWPPPEGHALDLSQLPSGTEIDSCVISLI